jgi:hypothetical protein
MPILQCNLRSQQTDHHAYTTTQYVIQHTFVYIGGNAFISQRHFHEGLRGQVMCQSVSPCHHSLVWRPTAADGGLLQIYCTQTVTNSLQGVVL